MAVPAHGLPSLLTCGQEVALVPPGLKGPRWYRVESLEPFRHGDLVGFAGVGGLDAASALVGKTVLARVDDLPADFELHDADALLGREVRDAAHGTLGTIEEVLMGPANDVWVVRGPFGEVLVPVVEGVVRELGPCVRVELPRGLVDEG